MDQTKTHPHTLSPACWYENKAELLHFWILRNVSRRRSAQKGTDKLHICSCTVALL